MTLFRPLVRRLADSVARAPQAEALVYGPTRLTYADLWGRIASVASFLRAHGVRKGDRVAVLLDNSPDYVAAYYGALSIGAVAVGLNPSARFRELWSWLTHCDARWLFADRRHVDFEDLAGASAGTLTIVTRGDAGGTDCSWPRATGADRFVPAIVRSDDPAAIIYTSGTTGRPKGVVLTHGNLSANTASIIEYLGLRSSDRVLNLLPFFYSYGSSVLHTHLAVGATLVLENSLVSPHRVLQRMVGEQVTGFPGVPSTYALLLQSSGLQTLDLSSVRYLTQAGGAMLPEHVRAMRTLMPHARFFVMYGQTEATARLTYVPPERLDEKAGSVGIPIPGVELEVHDERDAALPPGHIGEVCVRGANVMAGYYDDPDATSAVLHDGWLHTGDLGYLDNQGFLYLQGRRSDIIKSGAHRINPLDIEEVIAVLPEVAEVAVVGVADAVLGEAIKAVVSVRTGATLSQLQVQRHCSQQLPRYKVPKSVEFVGRLPRTSSGKVVRYRLTDTQNDDYRETHIA